MPDKLRYRGQPVEYEPGERWFVSFGTSEEEFPLKSVDFRKDQVVVRVQTMPDRVYLGKKLYYRVVQGSIAEPPQGIEDRTLPREEKAPVRRVGFNFFFMEEPFSQHKSALVETPLFQLSSLYARIFNDLLDRLYCERRQLEDLPIQREGDIAYIRNLEFQLRRHGIALEYRNLTLCLVFENGDYLEGSCVFRFHQAQRR